MFLKKIVSFAAVVAMLSASTSAYVSNFYSSAPILSVYAADGCTVPQYNIKSKGIPDLDCFHFTDSMGAGWNLGNTFDAVDDKAVKGDANMYLESAWVGTKTTKALIDCVSAAGFKTLRLPVSWHNHVDDNFNINQEWLNRVQEVIDYARADNMYVILNIHHDNEKEFMFPDYAHLDNSKKYVSAIWKQLAEKFSSYDEHLIFEALNEPRVKGSNYEWWYNSSASECKEAQDCINQYNQAAVDAIRAAGGKNSSRYIMVPGYCAKTQAAITNDFKLPNDSAKNRIIVSVHEYIPYNFAMAGANDNGSTTSFDANGSDGQEISNLMDTLYVKFISNNIPVVIGEFGTRNKNGNTQARVDYTAYYYASARARGITCCWWDNNTFDTYAGEAFGLIDRSNNSFTYNSIADAASKYGAGKGEYGNADKGDSTAGDGTLLPDGTILFNSAIGKKVVLTVTKDDVTAGGGGCLEFMAAVDGVNYWVAYAWNYDASGQFTIDMTTPTKVVNTSQTDSNGDGLVVNDANIIKKVADICMNSSSTKIQYWWAADNNWKNYASAAGHLKVTSIKLTDTTAPSTQPTQPTTGTTAQPTTADTTQTTTTNNNDSKVGEILSDGTLKFKSAIGKKVNLTIEKANDCAGGGGCLEFMTAVDGVNYWVAYEWNYGENGKYTVDMTKPVKVVNTDSKDSKGDGLVVDDANIIKKVAEICMNSSSTKIQYWWAADSNWKNYASATGHITVKSAEIENNESQPTTSTTSTDSKTLIGDANTDGKIDISDVVAVRRYLVNSTKYPISAEGIKNSDVNSDGINAQDAVAIQKYVFGITKTVSVA